MIEGLTPIILAGLDSTQPVDIVEGDAGPDGSRLAVWITDAGLTLDGAMLDARARVASDRAQCVCVSDSLLGAALLARDVAMSLDGERHAGGVLRSTFTSGALEDTTDPTRYRYSATVDVMLFTSRQR